MLIVECDIADDIVPTVLCAAAGGDVAPGLDGKVILAVGSSEGAVTLFDVNQVFRLGPCQENHLRTGDTAVVSWKTLHLLRAPCLRPSRLSLMHRL